MQSRLRIDRFIRRRVPGRGLAIRARWALTGFLAAFVTANVAAAEPSAWNVTQADVRVNCPLTVGGSFEAKTKSLSGTLALGTPRPPAFTGALKVDLRTLDTGIGLRNEHLREKYLEVGRGVGFETAELSDIRLADGDVQSFEGKTRFTGTFLVHGTTRKIEGQAQVRRDGATVRVEATFAVMLPDYGIPKPRYLGIGVKDEVEVKVSLEAIPVGPIAGGSR